MIGISPVNFKPAIIVNFIKRQQQFWTRDELDPFQVETFFFLFFSNLTILFILKRNLVIFTVLLIAVIQSLRVPSSNK